MRGLLIAIVLVWMARDALWIADHSPPLPLIHADYSTCQINRTGPIARPDHYTTHPYGGRKPDNA